MLCGFAWFAWGCLVLFMCLFVCAFIGVLERYCFGLLVCNGCVVMLLLCCAIGWLFSCFVCICALVSRYRMLVDLWVLLEVLLG